MKYKDGFYWAAECKGDELEVIQYKDECFWRSGNEHSYQQDDFFFINTSPLFEKFETPRQVLGKLPEPYSSQAITNALNHRGEKWLDQLREPQDALNLLQGAFPFYKSKEGSDYWYEFIEG